MSGYSLKMNPGLCSPAMVIYTGSNGCIFIGQDGCSTDAMNYAAWNGHLEVVKWLHANRSDGCSEDAVDYAAGYGHLETLKCFILIGLKDVQPRQWIKLLEMDI
jgi:hypothetical protein